MSSADFSQLVITRLMKPPCLRYTLFPSIYPQPLLCSYKFGSYQPLLLLANLSLKPQPYIRFLSIRLEVCLLLPSNFTSQWTPLLFGYTLSTTETYSRFSPVRVRPWRVNQTREEPEISVLPICIYSQIINLFSKFTQNLKLSAPPKSKCGLYLPNVPLDMVFRYQNLLKPHLLIF